MFESFLRCDRFVCVLLAGTYVRLILALPIDQIFFDMTKLIPFSVLLIYL